MGNNHVVDPLEETGCKKEIHSQSRIKEDHAIRKGQVVVYEKIQHTAGEIPSRRVSHQKNVDLFYIVELGGVLYQPEVYL